MRYACEEKIRFFSIYRDVAVAGICMSLCRDAEGLCGKERKSKSMSLQHFADEGECDSLSVLGKELKHVF